MRMSFGSEEGGMVGLNVNSEEEKRDVEKIAREVLGAMPVQREVGERRKGDEEMASRVPVEMGEKREKQ